MQTANLLAGVWGSLIFIVSLSFLLNPKKIRSFIAVAENEATALLCAMFSFVAGAVTVCLNNIWSSDWRILPTIFGWAMIVRGVAMFIAPEKIAKIMDSAKNKEWLLYAAFAATVAGLVSVYFAFVGK